jgi:hypothetical protein
VHVSEDRRDGADFAGRLGFPGGGVKVLDDNLIDAIIGKKNLAGGAAKFRGDDGLAFVHGPSLPGLIISPAYFATNCRFRVTGTIGR